MATQAAAHGKALKTIFWSVAAAVLAGWGLGIAWWAILEPSGASNDVLEFTIPAGTAAAVAAGQQPPLIPNSLELGRDRTMVIRNEDVVDHTVGTWTIPPGTDARIEATDEEGTLSCTFHPAGLIGLSIDERPAFASTLISALGIGIPMGLILGVAAVIGGRLKLDMDGPQPA